MKTHLIFALAIIAFIASAAADAKYSGGTGEPNDPYQIATPEDLNDIGNYEEDWNKHFILVNDVNLAQYTDTQFNIIGKWFGLEDPNNKPFTGVFDGNDQKIWNFTWSSTDVNGIGLFGYVGEGGHIKNIGMENVDANAVNGDCVGGLCGWNQGTISDCYATGNVSGGSGSFIHGGLCGKNIGTISACYASCTVTAGWDCFGGLCGLNEGMISDCYAIGTVIGGNESCYLGGLCGNNWYGTITDCYATGNVTGSSYLGGLCGGSCYGTISGCYATGAVTGGWEFGGNIGGLCGLNGGTIIACYATGVVNGGYNSWQLGGLCGFNYEDCTINYCYATGNVTGGDNSGNLGGLCGDNNRTISDCYATGAVTGGDNSQYLGGLCGKNYRTIGDCYATGAVTGGVGSLDLGGLCGLSWWPDDVAFCFWNIQTSDCNTSSGGTPKTTAEMKTKSTFTDASWDFVGETTNGTNDIWRMCVDGVQYPLLSWQFVPDFVCPDGVDIFDLAFFVGKWLGECDETNNFCNCTDTNYDHQVDFRDFAILASHWLECNLEPPSDCW